jgi:molybdopterin synthase catalytic subunit
MIKLTFEPIDCEKVVQQVRSPAAGAVVLFLGTTRSETGGRGTESLDYECYESMALEKLRQIDEAARSRWPIVESYIVHRLGHLQIGETSVAVAVSTAHRADAFQAGQWLIDTIKLEVPIWKRENWADGTCEWVHPSGATSSEPELGIRINST